MIEFGLNDVGGILRLTVEEDGEPKNISAASVIKYLIKKPDETVSEVTASFDSNGADGKVIYTFVSGDLNQVGLYEIQVKLTIGGWTGISSSFFCVVRETLVVTV